MKVLAGKDWTTIQNSQSFLTSAKILILDISCLNALHASVLQW